MKKNKGTFLKALHSVCMIFVIAFGIITIVASGGGGDGDDDTGDETGANSNNAAETILVWDDVAWDEGVWE